MSLWKWSRNPASNNTADPSVNWVEGQPPSSVNDSARGMMAATAKYRDDIAGATATAGGPNAYTLSTFQGFDTLAHLHGSMLAFTINVTNAAGVTLSVDSLGARPVRSAPGVELLAGVLIAGTPYICTYNNTAGEFLLSGFYGNPYNVPIAGSLSYFGATSPNSSFILPFGQQLSRATYAAFFNIIGTAYGAGDGTTTFNAPDARGRLLAYWDSMGGTPAGRLTYALTGIDGTTIGATGGAQNRTLTIANLPAHGHTGIVNVTTSGTASGTAAGNATGTAAGNATGTASISGNATGTGTLTSSGTPAARGSGTLTGTGTAAHSGTLTGTGTSGAMSANASHSHGVTGGTVGGTSSVNVQQTAATTVPVGASNIAISSTNTDHTHSVSVSVPYALSDPISTSVPFNLALALDAISVPYSLSLPYSASSTVTSAYSTTVTSAFSVAVNSTVSATGGGSFTTDAVGSGSAFSTAQNTLVANMILRII